MRFLEQRVVPPWWMYLLLTCMLYFSPQLFTDASNSVEKSIGLPKNQALENPSFPDVFQSDLLLMLIRHQYSATSHMESESIFDCVSAAAHQAWKNRKRAQAVTTIVDDRSLEPARAIVDGMYCFEYSVGQNAVGKKGQGKSPGWLHSFIARFKTPSKSKCGTGQKRTFEYQDPTTKRKTREVFNDAHVDCLMCPEVTESLPYPSRFAVEEDDRLRIYFPLIYVENKRADKSLRQALHQCQMYCIFGVEFLAAFGITDFPVFGVFTAATEGEIIMAWKSSKSVEADYRTFNPKVRL